MVRVSPVQGVGTDSPIRSSPQTFALLDRPPFFFPPSCLDGLKNQKCSLGGRKEQEANRKEKKKTKKLGKRGKQTVSYRHIADKGKEEKRRRGKGKKKTPRVGAWGGRGDTPGWGDSIVVAVRPV